jgi:hypothetical protein
MTVELTRVDPFFFALWLAGAFWMRRRPVFFAKWFAKFFSPGWLGGLLIGGEFRAEQARRNPPRWLISLVSWIGLIGIWSTLAEMAIWFGLVAKGYRIY